MKQTKQLITKEVIRGWMRNWICQAINKKGKKDNLYHFVFEMENISFDKGEIVLTNELSFPPKNEKIIVFYIDNFMRVWLGLNNNEYVWSDRKNLSALKKMINPYILKNL